MLRGSVYAFVFAAVFALLTGLIAAGATRDPEEARALGVVFGYYGTPAVMIVGFLTGWFTRRKPTPPTPAWREPEDPHARWTCPKCRKDNPNTTFVCPCGYRVV